VSPSAIWNGSCRVTLPVQPCAKLARDGSDRGAAALAVRQDEAETLITGAMELDARGRS
jgi:hypothetical protein